MEKEENQRVRLTRRLLEESLLRLMREKRIENISVTELCRDAHINRATFYRYYRIPMDVMVDLARRITEEMGALIPDQEEAYYDGSYAVAICRFLWERRDTMKTVLSVTPDQELEKLFTDMFRRFWESSPYLNSHRYTSEEDRQLISTMISSGCYHMIRQWLLNDIRKTPDEIAELITRVYSCPPQKEMQNGISSGSSRVPVGD